MSLRYSAVGELTVTLQGSSNSFVSFCFTLSIISSRWVQCQVLKNSSKFCIFLCERISDDKRTPFLHYLPHGNTGQRPTQVLPSEIIWLKLFVFFLQQFWESLLESSASLPQTEFIHNPGTHLHCLTRTEMVRSPVRNSPRSILPQFFAILCVFLNCFFHFHG